MEFQLKCRFPPKISRIGQNEFQIRFLRHFLHSLRKTCTFGFTCPLRPSAKRAWVGPTSGLALEDFSLARFAQGITVFIRLNATAFIKFFII